MVEVVVVTSLREIEVVVVVVVVVVLVVDVQVVLGVGGGGVCARVFVFAYVCVSGGERGGMERKGGREGRAGGGEDGEEKGRW